MFSVQSLELEGVLIPFPLRFLSPNTTFALGSVTENRFEGSDTCKQKTGSRLRCYTTQKTMTISHYPQV